MVSLVPRLPRNVNMYRRESLVSFLHKHDVIEIGMNTERKCLACCSNSSFPGHVGGARKWPENEATAMNCL